MTNETQQTKSDSLAWQMVYSTVPICIEDPDNEGEAIVIGTGFGFNYMCKGISQSFVVTNKHVLKAVTNKKLVMIFARGSGGKPVQGYTVRLNVSDFERNVSWFGHPDDGDPSDDEDNGIDVAIIPISGHMDIMKLKGAEIYLPSMAVEHLPIRVGTGDLEGIDAIEEIVFIGYPFGVRDEQNSMPIVRKGITATPISLDFQGKQQFLIDASVFGGSSGSPVYIYNPVWHLDGGNITVGPRLVLVGLVASSLESLEKIELDEARIIEVSRQAINLGWVFKSSTIVETIEAFIQNGAFDEGYKRAIAEGRVMANK